jgi:epoxide hydrolase-like predicted phosphatase
MKNMGIRAVIFDMGGVLIRTEDPSQRIKWESRLGLKPGGLADLVFGSDVAAQAAVGKLAYQDVWDFVGKQLGLSREQQTELERDFWSGDRVNVELVRFIQELRPKYQTAILSNAWPGARETLTKVYKLADLVHAVVISAEEGVVKPDERIYGIAADRLGVRPNQTIFVDDFVENVEGARAVGMLAVRYLDNAQTVAEINRLLNPSKVPEK